MSLHSSIHLSICLLYGNGFAKRTGIVYHFYTVYIHQPTVHNVYFQFEYQQAQLEKEIEELSWKVERAESTDRGVCLFFLVTSQVFMFQDLENQICIAEKKRQTLLQDFFD